MVDSLRQVATRANNRSDEVSAFRYNRKAEIVAACLDKGSVAAFAKSLDDAEGALEFFDRIGPPPGYDDDYYDQLAHLYWDGDSLTASATKMAFGALSEENQQFHLAAKLEDDGHLVAPRRFKPAELLERPQLLVAHIADKYVASFVDLDIEPTTISFGLETIDVRNYV